MEKKSPKLTKVSTKRGSKMIGTSISDSMEQQQPLSEHSAPSPEPILRQKRSLWTEHQAPDGRLYYFNKSTKQSSWTKPEELNMKQESITTEVRHPTPNSDSSTSTALTLQNLSISIPPTIRKTIQNHLCQMCKYEMAVQRCLDCHEIYCSECVLKIHQDRSKSGHILALITVRFCESCESSSATQECYNCCQVFCDECASFLHRKPPKHRHHRGPVSAGSTHSYNDHERNQMVGDVGRKLVRNLSSSIHDSKHTQEESKNMLQQLLVVQRQPLYPTCRTCHGWGLDLLGNNGLCKHCTRSAEEKYTKLTRCGLCWGWGVGLVISQNVCNHCNRQLAAKATVTRYQDGIARQVPEQVSQRSHDSTTTLQQTNPVDVIWDSDTSEDWDD